MLKMKAIVYEKYGPPHEPSKIVQAEQLHIELMLKLEKNGSARTSAEVTNEKFYEKYAWVILLAAGLLWLMVGIVAVYAPEGIFEGDAQSFTNIPWSELKALSPVAANFVIFIYRQMGLLMISWALFVIAITLTGYRKGEKWAWYIMWSVPAHLVSNALFNSIFIGDISQTLPFIPMTTVTLLGLLLPYRKFFPR
jgi:hypothetical protein